MRLLALCLCILSVGLSSEKRCRKLKSGFNKIRNGVDITKLDWLPLDQTGDDGFRSPIIDFTCDEENLKNRSLGRSLVKRTDDDNSQIPDQVVNTFKNPTGTLSSSVDIYKTSREYQKTMSVKAGVAVAGGLFSASASYTKIQKSIQKSESYVEEAQVHVTTFDVQLKSFKRLEVSEDAKSFIQDLPSEPLTEENLEDFNEVITQFGTHYIERAKFGGTLRFLIDTQKSFFSNHNEDQIEIAVRGMVKSVTLTGEFSQNTAEKNEAFESASTKRISYFGGRTNLLSEGHGLKDWQPTVKDNPMLFSGTLKPIYKLIKDRAKRKSMEKAHEIYLAKAYLAEIKKKIEFAEYPDLGNRFYRRNFNKLKRDIQNRIKPLESKVMLLREEVNELASDIKTQIKESCENDIDISEDPLFGSTTGKEREDVLKSLAPACQMTINELFSADSI